MSKTTKPLGALGLLTLCGLPSSALAAGVSDGSSVTVSSSQVLNEYAELASSVSAGATTLTVTDIGDLDERSSGTYAQGSVDAGTLLLVIQMQGASFTTSDSSSFGTHAAVSFVLGHRLADKFSEASNFPWRSLAVCEFWAA